MNALIIFLVAMVILVIGYVCYGGWLASNGESIQSAPTPAHELEDGVDYVPAPPYVVLGHHFSSIAGAGPINGPIQAAVFGWVPVLLWVLVGGIFFGAMLDFGALFASLRHKGQTLAVVVAENIDNTAKKLFCIFAYLTLLLVVAAFASIVANTFVSFRLGGPGNQPRQRADGHDLGHLHRCRRRLRLRHARPQHSRPREHCLCDHPDCHHGCHRIQLAAYGHRDLARL